VRGLDRPCRARRQPSRSGTITRDTQRSRPLDWLELDLCVTDGGVLVLRHHSRLPGGRPVHTLTLSELRRLEPDILTLSEAAEHLGGRVPMLVDVKGSRVVAPLTRWLVRQGRAGTFAICSESRDTLAHMREAVPWVQRWRTLTALWRCMAEDSIPVMLRPLLWGLFPGGTQSAAEGVTDTGGDIADLWTALLGTERVAERLRRIAATAERDRLPSYVGKLANEVGAAAITVDHWAITPQLCEVAHRLNLAVAAWTVNRIEVALDLARCGVDAITSDEVATIREAVQRLGGDDRGSQGRVAVSRRPAQSPPHCELTAGRSANHTATPRAAHRVSR
jgi:glycerophosphoryl diester phosphodiesterase